MQTTYHHEGIVLPSFDSQSWARFGGYWLDARVGNTGNVIWNVEPRFSKVDVQESVPEPVLRPIVKQQFAKYKLNQYYLFQTVSWAVLPK